MWVGSGRAVEADAAPPSLNLLHAEATRYVALWRPRLGIAEVVSVEIVDDDESTDRELEARCIPIQQDGEGLWCFTLQVGDTIELERLESAIVHELVHVIIEPLRARVFFGKTEAFPRTVGMSLAQVIERWETVVDRLADAYLRAYDALREFSAT